MPLAAARYDNDTLETVEDYVNDARVILQDVIPGYRYADDELVTALNVAFQMARGMRADIFVYNYGPHTPNFLNNDSTVVYMEPQFRPAIVYGMVGHALSRDQEDYQDARATAFMNLMSTLLTGRPMPAGFAGGSPPSGGR